MTHFDEFCERFFVIFAALTRNYESSNEHITIDINDSTQEELSIILWDIWARHKDDGQLSTDILKARIHPFIEKMDEDYPGSNTFLLYALSTALYHMICQDR